MERINQQKKMNKKQIKGEMKEQSRTTNKHEEQTNRDGKKARKQTNE